ncbi:MAG: DUF1553 domain-containing protein [Bryobacterales bacterium]|nr:DUF1553 domain-containing protein [Bryobacterales bacterium]
MSRTVAVLVLLVAWGAPGVAAPEALLARRCLSCHNDKARSAGLSLATRADAVAGGALVPGDPASSRLYQRIERGEMPPGAALPKEEREAIREWIAAGAPWAGALSEQPSTKRAGRDWWSLQPLGAAPPPGGTGRAIDRYLQAALASKGLKMGSPADRRTFIRRATFDLTGLPPEPEDVAAFVSDPSPRAEELLIDRLLASPRYGERWGRHWLDVVRFGESHGYEQNHLRDRAWPFRDYVIRSLNEDKPFDQLILEHLAGDQVAAGDPAVEAGTGFLVAGPFDTVGIADLAGTLQKRANALDDIVTATAAGFLGLTVNCARCHDHKFDPIPQTDYYRLQSIFGGVQFAERPWAPPAEIARYEAALHPLRKREDELAREIAALRDRAKPLLAERRAGIEASFRPPVDPKGTEERFAPVRVRFLRMRIESASSPSVSLDELEVFDAAGRNIALGATASASSTRMADDDASAYDARYVTDGSFDKRWISDTTPASVTIELREAAEAVRIVWSADRLGAFQGRFVRSVPVDYVIEASTDGRTWRHLADGRNRLPFNAARRETLLAQIALPEAERTRWVQADAELGAVRARIGALPKPPSAFLGTFEQPAKAAYVMQGGDPMRHGPEVAPASLDVLADLLPGFTLPADAAEGERRLLLAHWITDRRNALTARVLANRVWHYHFGRGLVGTPSDFGSSGERPSHPELLDYLARRLLVYGWRLKPLHREIMLSAAYRQSSAPDAAALRADSEARLLWRFPPRRLEAEAIRDAVLAVSGKLNREMYGPGFRLYRYTVDNVATYYPLEQFGPETYRRAVYHQAARSVRVDLLGQFDCPDSSLPAPRRDVTTSPLQALTLLNNAFLLDQARFFGERLEREAPDTGGRIRRAFLLALGREPDREEQAAAERLIAGHGLAAFARGLFNATEFVSLR